MIDFAALSEAFAPITKVGRGEATLEVGGHKVTLRVLLPEEDAAVLRVSSQILRANADGEDKVEKHVMMTYFDTVRTEILCYAIVELDGLDLRNVDYVATGEKTTSGKLVRVTKNVAIRDLIRKKQPWSTVMLTLAYNVYTNLLEKTEQEGEDLVEWDPSDLQAEIERVQKRLETLEKTLEDRAKGDPNLLADQIRAIKQYDDASRRAAGKGPMASASQEPAPRPAATEPEFTQTRPPWEKATPVPTPAPPEDEWADFAEAMPLAADLRDIPEPEPEPDPEPEPPPPQEPVPSRRTEPRRSVVPPTSPPPTGIPMRPTPPVDPLADVMDSFQDPSDASALVAEQDRIIGARRQMLIDQQQASRVGEMTAVHRPRAAVPPHLRGREPQAGVPDGPSIDMTQAVDVNGIPAFRLPTQELSARGRGARGAPVSTDQVSDGSTSRNPKFRPAGG